MWCSSLFGFFFIKYMKLLITIFFFSFYSALLASIWALLIYWTLYKRLFVIIYIYIYIYIYISSSYIINSSRLYRVPWTSLCLSLSLCLSVSLSLSLSLTHTHTHTIRPYHSWYVFQTKSSVCALVVMVIVVENEPGDRSSNPGRSCGHFTER